TNSLRDAFLMDLETNEIQRMSASDELGQADFEAVGATISANGRHVGFISSAITLSGSVAGFTQAFVATNPPAATPLPGSFTFETVSGSEVEADFGNIPLPTISGVVYYDANESTTLDESDLPLEG